MSTLRKQILLTNDDGIQSPGLWAAAAALSHLGFVTVAAPREQASGAGRSSPSSSDGKIQVGRLQINQQDWQVYAVGGTPSQAVLHALLEIMPEKPDLVVSGINYGENVGTAVTMSGTVGAAIEGAAMGIPSLAVSLEVDPQHWFNYGDIDFSVAAHFTQLIACSILEGPLPEDVHLLKVEVPASATLETPWRVTRLANHRYYYPHVERSGTWEDQGRISASIKVSPDEVPTDSDVYAVVYDKVVSVTPISLDMTSRIALSEFDQILRRG